MCWQRRTTGMNLTRSEVARLGGALLLAVSAGVHARLYRGGYRDISVDRLLGVDIGRSFALATIATLLLSLLLVVSVVWGTAPRALSLAGAAIAAGAVVGYVLSRTVGLLGFVEERWISEAVLVKPVEVGAVVLLAVAAARRPQSAT